MDLLSYEEFKSLKVGDEITQLVKLKVKSVEYIDKYGEITVVGSLADEWEIDSNDDIMFTK